MIGTIISHYRILDKLGEGGMGVVYKAHDTKLDRVVALKFLPDRVNQNETEKARFLQEARAVAALNHPNICTIHNIEESNGSVFLVMEYVEGGTLRNKIPFAKVDDAIPVAIQIGEALQEAHSKGIVHRDVKADNVMLNAKGQAKVMDFGLAKLKGSLKLTKTSSTVGTLGYMAPEQIQGGEVDHRSDIFSFGVLLFEMLTGHLPFRGEHEAAMVYSIVNEEPQHIEQLLPDLSPIIGNLIQRCLEKDPAERYQHFDDITADLKRSQKKTTKVARSSPDRPVTKAVEIPAKSKLKSALTAAAVIVLAAVGVYLFMSKSGNEQKTESASTSAEGIKTLAVLPFLNMSSDKEQEYFSDGLSEELLNVLAKNPRLRITSRTSAFSFKGTNTDIKTIASKLNVKYLLEGSVRKAGNALRITAQLIDVETDAHLWSDTYEGTMANIFAVQDTISRSVAEALNAALLGSPGTPRKHETTPEAYNNYMLGRHFQDLSGKENWAKAEEYFQKAIAIDPTYAAAWFKLGQIHTGQADRGYIPVDIGYRKAKQEVDKALEPDPNYANAHALMGWIRYTYDWDWTGADESYQRALKLEPGNRNVLNGAASLASSLGRLDESTALYRRVTQVDPVGASGFANLGNQLEYVGQLDEAEIAQRKCIELDPQRVLVHYYLGRIYMDRGKPESALVEMMKETEPSFNLLGRALIYYSFGRKREADSTLAAYIKEYQDGAAYQVADIYAFRGETDKAFEWLERAYIQRDGGLTDLKVDPLVKNIRKDPRYKEFLKKMKLPI